MSRQRIFISSVQVEFAEMRQALYDYILADALLGRFFDPFIFESLPAADQRADAVYLREVEQCQIYLALLGKHYCGSSHAIDISPTELEFDHASEYHKTRLMFLTEHTADERDEKQNAFIDKVQSVVVRKSFSTVDELKAAVYAALVNYLIEKDIVRIGPFDATLMPSATIENDIDTNKVIDFVRVAKSKRGFHLNEFTPVPEILMHLNLMQSNQLTHAAILLFGKHPQRYFTSSEVRCAHFHGTIVEKPIPSYKVLKGDVFELVDLAVDFVLSKLDYAIGTRSESTSIPGHYEIPREVVTEAIVNAVAHRDYTSNGSIQIMLFSDRLEILNPGSLPLGWSIDRLKHIHPSVPANPLLAEPMYLKGYIERLGTGTVDIFRLSKECQLKEPIFEQNEDFTTIIYRPSTDQVPTKLRSSSDQVLSTEMQHLFLALNGEMSRAEIQKLLDLKHTPTFRENYLEPALKQEFIKMKYPDNPNHPQQRYSLAAKANEWLVEHGFASELYRPSTDQVPTKYRPSTDQVPTSEILSLLNILNGEMSRSQIQKKLQLKHTSSFRKSYLEPALQMNVIAMKYPENPNHPRQKYLITEKGRAFLKNKHA